MSNVQVSKAERIYNQGEVEDCTLDSKFTVGALSSDVYKNENGQFVLGRADPGMAYISFTPTVGVYPDCQIITKRYFISQSFTQIDESL